MFTIADFAQPPQLPPAVIRQIPSSKVTKRTLAGDPTCEYYLYVPKTAVEGAPVLVAVHGISRNARAQAKTFAEFADRYGVVIVAPLFSGQRFPGYQRLGISRRGAGPRPDLVLNAMLTEVSAITGARTDRFYLFGFSGGGQFAHRYAMAHPGRVLAVAMGAPGWYTYPDQQARYPRGLDLPARDGLPRLASSEFLRVPMAVFVGQHDKLRDEALKKSRRVDAQQGLTRIERGQRWVDAMRAAAAQRLYQTRYEFRILDDCDHSFRHCMRRGEMGWRVFEFLFGPTASRRSFRHGHYSTNSAFLVFNAA